MNFDWKLKELMFFTKQYSLFVNAPPPYLNSFFHKKKYLLMWILKGVPVLLISHRRGWPQKKIIKFQYLYILAIVWMCLKCLDLSIDGSSETTSQNVLFWLANYIPTTVLPSKLNIKLPFFKSDFNNFVFWMLPSF